MAVMIRTAGVQDRAGAITLLSGLSLASSCRAVFADQGLSGHLVAWAARVPGMVVRIVANPPASAGSSCNSAAGWSNPPSAG